MMTAPSKKGFILMILMLHISEGHVMFALSRSDAEVYCRYSLTAAVGQHHSTACSTLCTAESATGGARRPEYVITSHA